MANTVEPVRVRFGEFLLDLADERLIGPGGPIRIGNKAFRVLRALAAMRGRLLTKEELFETVWDGARVSESALTSVIKELRRALGDDSKAPRFIGAVYGRGYRFLAPVKDEPAGEEPPPSERQPAVQGDTEAIEWVFWRNSSWRFAGLGAVAAAVIASIWFLQRPDASGTRVRIEPLRVIGNNPVARLLSQNLASELSRLGVANNSTIVISDARDPATAPADYIFAGEVQNDGRAWHVAVRLIDGARQILWSRDFSAPAQELASLRQQMAVRTGEVLVCAFGARSRRPAGTDLATLRPFLAACETYNSDWSAARPVLARLVEGAPRFAQARGMYANVLARLAPSGAGPEQRDRLKREAVAQARQALRDDPHIGSAYGALAAVIPFTAAQLPDKDAILRRGIAADPVSAELRAPRCMVLRSLGFGADGQSECERALALDTLSPGTVATLAETYAFNGRVPDALNLLDDARRSWPGEPATSYVRFETIARWGDARQALAVLDSSGGDSGYRPPFSILWRAFLNARIDPGQTQGAVQTILAHASGAPLEAQVTAIRQLVQLRRLDEAYRIAAALPADAGFSRAWFEGFMEPFRADARFPRFLRQQGLTQARVRLRGRPDFCAEPGLSRPCPVTPGGWMHYGR
ncbi:winged helix-turn-helix domain-containing protein [Sphingomonas sp. PL-96]|uniref:winged helix-turn-helix domain-containing protein n=1 Tax=Sphingomonas sp. PL-96 TaxID=2887201 RepID=UPI001E383273|nr:winged helix-turn-helix domain-containing protein [Sphingomonas sp. PL-96]MCC2977619.1 winged helix-turn-helix domain-containing protein [Sphingomonas sp. PL-96]